MSSYISLFLSRRISHLAASNIRMHVYYVCTQHIFLHNIRKSHFCKYMVEKNLSLTKKDKTAHIFSTSSVFVGEDSLFSRLVLKEEILSDIRLKAIINKVLESGRTYARRHRSPSPLMYQYYGTEYLGAAHGLMGILQMLLR